MPHITEISVPCPPIAGRVVSTTVIVWLTVSDLLPQASTAHHSLVKLYDWEQVPFTRTVVESSIGMVSQLSWAVGEVNMGVPVHEMVTLAPWPLTVGGMVSVTVMVWLTGFEMLPQASVALQVLVTL